MNPPNGVRYTWNMKGGRRNLCGSLPGGKRSRLNWKTSNKNSRHSHSRLENAVVAQQHTPPADDQNDHPIRPQERNNRRRSLWATLRIISIRERSWGSFSGVRYAEDLTVSSR